MEFAKIGLMGLFAISALSSILMIGRERKVITREQAATDVVLSGAIIYLITLL